MRRVLAILTLSLALSTQAQDPYTGYVVFPTSLAQGRTIPIPYSDLGNGYYQVTATLTLEQAHWAMSLWEVYKNKLPGVLWGVLDKDGNKVYGNGD